MSKERKKIVVSNVSEKRGAPDYLEYKFNVYKGTKNVPE